MSRVLSPQALENNRRSSREAKQRRRGVCVECGAETRYAGYRGQPLAPHCKPCGDRISADKKRYRGSVVERFLPMCDGATPISEIARILGISVQHAGVLAGRMIRYGAIVRVARGRYLRVEP
jgi:hypothetical protein